MKLTQRSLLRVLTVSVLISTGSSNFANGSLQNKSEIETRNFSILRKITKSLSNDKYSYHRLTLNFEHIESGYVHVSWQETRDNFEQFYNTKVLVSPKNGIIIKSEAPKVTEKKRVQTSQDNLDTRRVLNGMDLLEFFNVGSFDKLTISKRGANYNFTLGYSFNGFRGLRFVLIDDQNKIIRRINRHL